MARISFSSSDLSYFWLANKRGRGYVPFIVGYPDYTLYDVYAKMYMCFSMNIKVLIVNSFCYVMDIERCT